MADLVGGDREHVVGRADVPDRAGVDLDVAGERVVVHRRRLVAPAQGRGPEVIAADADVAHAGVTLLVVPAAHRGPVVGDDDEVDVGLRGPGLRRQEELLLPPAGQVGVAVEGRLQVADGAAHVGPIRHEADGDDLRVHPGVAGGRVEDDAGLQQLESGPTLARLRAPGRARRPPLFEPTLKCVHDSSPR